MVSFRLALFVAAFFWALGLQAAPAMHNHRNLHARHMHIHHRHARSHSPQGAPHVLSEASQAPSESARAWTPNDSNVDEFATKRDVRLVDESMTL
ncbi:hypothetical protein FALBO_1597 [Fusarium albosuccineum]|uniref:Uncharacterized protein n=1 Tax=Fusarium albosuccineum TaxID=1237068 RepID=A0A8H4LPW8_9HYPO|nr:hypothetical protein FALBO_1597 [Fusarium albosuccineum]